MQIFTRGDLLRGPAAQLLNPDNTPVNLTIDTIKFRLVRQKDGQVKVNHADATIISTVTAEVAYAWQSEDIDEVRDYYAWFIRAEGGETEHFPAGRGYVIRIVDDKQEM